MSATGPLDVHPYVYRYREAAQKWLTTCFDRNIWECLHDKHILAMPFAEVGWLIVWGLSFLQLLLSADNGRAQCLAINDRYLLPHLWVQVYSKEFNGLQ